MVHRMEPEGRHQPEGGGTALLGAPVAGSCHPCPIKMVAHSHSQASCTPRHQLRPQRQAALTRVPVLSVHLKGSFKLLGPCKLSLPPCVAVAARRCLPLQAGTCTRDPTAGRHLRRETPLQAGTCTTDPTAGRYLH